MTDKGQHVARGRAYQALRPVASTRHLGRGVLPVTAAGKNAVSQRKEAQRVLPFRFSLASPSPPLFPYLNRVSGMVGRCDESNGWCWAVRKRQSREKRQAF